MDPHDLYILALGASAVTFVAIVRTWRHAAEQTKLLREIRDRLDES